MTKDRLGQEVNLNDWCVITSGSRMNVGIVKGFNKSGSPRLQLNAHKKELVSAGWKMECGKSVSLFVKVLPTREMELAYENIK